MIEFLRILPKNYLSFIVGKLASVRLPKFLHDPFLSWYIRKYGVNVEEAEFPLDTYPSLAKFFVRNLKEGIRPITGDLVSPVDGTLRSIGSIANDTINDVKGQSYTLAELFQGSNMREHFRNGTYFNFYLAPGDYHHIHSPVTGRVQSVSYIPGKLWPVNDWSLKNIPKLFAQNERIITILESQFGLVGVVMVGATNVGKITLEFDSNIVGNQLSLIRTKKVYETMYQHEIQVRVGEKIGTFHLGSSVILLFQDSNSKIKENTILHAGKKVKLGDALISAASDKQ